MSTEFTKEDLFRLFQETRLQIQETNLQLQKTDEHMKEELFRMFQETNVQIQATNLQLQKTDAQLQKTDVQLQKTDVQLQKTDEQQQKTEQFLKELSKNTDKQIRELGKQIGGLGNKFGGLIEGMAFPSMEKLLRTKFKMEVIAQRVKSKVLGDNQEIDILAYANTTINQVIVVELKSRLGERELQSTMDIMEKFRSAFPEHAQKQLIGILATVDASEEMKKRVIAAGLYLAIVNDDHFRLKVPNNFQPRQF